MKILYGVGLALGLTGMAMASTPAAAPVPLPQAAANCPSPSPEPNFAKAPDGGWKHGTDEYNDYTGITGTQGKPAPAPADAIKNAANFIQKYPDSNYKLAVMGLLAKNQLAARQYADAFKTATTLVNSPGVTAGELALSYNIIAVYGPTLGTDSAIIATIKRAGTCGMGIVSAMPAASQPQASFFYQKAQGYAALNSNEPAAAVALLNKAAGTALGQKDASVWFYLGDAELQTLPKNATVTPEMQKTEVLAIFHIARAASLDPKQTVYSNYLNDLYNKYHGSPDGMQSVMSAAAASPEPPAGFNIESATDIENSKNEADYNAAVAKAKADAAAYVPPEESFPGIEFRLIKPDRFPDFIKQIKGKGYEIEGTVIASTAQTVELAVDDADVKAGRADLHLTLTDPLAVAKRPKPGTKIKIDGAVDSFTASPFVLKMVQGSVPGVSPAAGGGGGER